MAIPALVAGVAFFLTSCERRVAVKPSSPDRAAPEAFARAEAYADRGDTHRAIEAYEAFVRQHPRSGKAPAALERIADLHASRGEFAESLGALEKIEEVYPDYPRLDAVSCRMVEQLHDLGLFARSKDQAYRWLATYRGHPMAGKVLYLLGDDLLRLGDRPGAFLWWLKLEREGLPEPKGGARVRERLQELIDTSPAEALYQMVPYARDTPYLAPVYYRIARLSLQGGDLEGARKAAESLLRSTGEEKWLASGRELLAQIEGGRGPAGRVVGCLLPLTGPFAIYGQEALNGIRLGLADQAVSQDPPFELAVRDTRGEPEQAVRGLEELAGQEKVMAVIGPLTSKTAPAAARRAQELGMPLIALTQKSDLLPAGDMIFRNFLTPPMEVSRLLDVAMGDLAIRRFAVLYPNNSYGSALSRLFQEGVRARGGEIVAVESYDPAQTDFESQIRKMAALDIPGTAPSMQPADRADAGANRNPQKTSDEKDLPILPFEAVFIPDNYERVAMVAPQLLYHDVRDVQLLGTSLWQSPRLLELAGNYVQGALFPSGFFPGSEDPGVASFVRGYEAGHGTTPGILAASGYDTARVLAKLMTEPGCDTRKHLQQRLLSMEAFQGVTGAISFDRQGEVRKEPFLLRVSGRGLKAVQQGRSGH